MDSLIPTLFHLMTGKEDGVEPFPQDKEQRDLSVLAFKVYYGLLKHLPVMVSPESLSVHRFCSHNSFGGHFARNSAFPFYVIVPNAQYGIPSFALGIRLASGGKW